jgi:rhodanese-related sulfurtransferase
MNPEPLPISAATAQRRQRTGALLVDIRPQVARHQGSITEAMVIDADAIVERLTPESRDREIVLCSVSSRRAIPTAEHLARLGYRHVYYLAGGYAAWQTRHCGR